MERVARLFGWTEAVREMISGRRPPVEQADVDRDLAAIRVQLDGSTTALLWAEGQTLTMEPAIALALEPAPI